MKTVLVCGAGGFIGSHLVKSLKNKGHFVVGVDIKAPEYSEIVSDKFYIADLRDIYCVDDVFSLHKFDEVYQLAADMGGAGYISTGVNDSDIMHNSILINLNILDACKRNKVPRLFYSSTACVYPEHNQIDLASLNMKEDSAYPAYPDSEYGWEKLFSERLYASYAKNHGIQVRIARLHNVFGPYGCFDGGKEKAPAALCRKIALANNNGEIEVWGSGEQVRSFLYIDECIEGIHRIMDSDYDKPLNLGSERMITINDLAKLIIKFSNKNVAIRNIDGPLGVNIRTSDNTLIYNTLAWKPSEDLEHGLLVTYNWIQDQIGKGND